MKRLKKFHFEKTRITRRECDSTALVEVIADMTWAPRDIIRQESLGQSHRFTYAS